MKRFLSKSSRALAALMAAALCLAPISAPARAADPSQTILSELGRTTEPYQRLVLDSIALLNLTLQGAGQSIFGSDTEKPAWLDTWKAQVAAARQTVAAERDAIKPFQSQAFDANAADPGVARMRTALRAFPKRVTAVADQVLATVDDLVPLVDTAATGDLQSKSRLQLAVLKGLNASMDAQDAILDITVLASVEGHPEVALAQAVKAMHDARRGLQQFRIDQLSGLNPDPQVTLTAARASLAQSRAAAARAPRLAAAMVKQIQASPLSPTMKAKIIDAFGTYQASADIEIKIADVIEQSMHIYVEDVSDPEASQALDRELAALSKQRVDLQMLRRNKVL